MTPPQRTSPRRLILLGSTGSIGTNALAVAGQRVDVVLVAGLSWGEGTYDVYDLHERRTFPKERRASRNPRFWARGLSTDKPAILASWRTRSSGVGACRNT